MLSYACLFICVLTCSLVETTFGADCDFDLIRGRVGAGEFTKCVDGEEEAQNCPHFKHLKGVFDGEKCVDPHFQCPESEGVFGHRISHLSYFVCRSGVPTHQYCPVGKVFDGLTCVSVLISQKSNDKNIRYAFECQSDMTYRDPESRHNYISCKDDVARVYQCPEVVIDNDRKDQKWIQIFDGNNCVTPFECPEIDGMIKRTANGQVVYRCIAGVALHNRCPDGYAFDGRSCVHDYIISDPYKCHESNGYFVNKHNESQFYHCLNDRPVLMECPSRSIFSGQSCLFTGISHGIQYPPFVDEREQSRFIDERQTISYNCPYDGIFSNPRGRHNYIICRDGRAHVQQCPVVEENGKTWYEVFDGRQCIPAWECPEIDGTSKLTPSGRVYYRCINGVPSQHTCTHGQTFDGHSCVDGFRCLQSSGVFRNPNNNRDYYQCVNYRPILRTCPALTFFDGQSCVSDDRYPDRHNYYKLIFRDRNLVKFVFNDKLVVDTLNQFERKWDREISAFVPE